MQVTVETEQAQIVFVLVPDNAIDFAFSYTEPIEFRIKTANNEYLSVDLPEGLYGPLEILGSPFSLTEEQWCAIVDYSEMADMGIDDHEGGYLCYQRNYWFHKTATEAGKSLLSIKEIYQTNPMGPKLGMSAFDDDEKSLNENHSDYFRYEEQWHEAQSRTGNWQTLVKYKSNG